MKERMKIEELVNKKENFLEQIKKLSRFDTDGFDEYPENKFKKYIGENKINVELILDDFLNSLDPADRYSENEMYFVKAFRAWLHCDFENAQKYINNKFDFECKNNNDFLNKYKFFNTVAVFIFENEHIAFESDIILRERYIFETLRNKTKENKGSFLLNYLSQDYLAVIDKKKFSVQGDKDLDDIPYKITPKQYAFDSKSFFALIHKNDLKRNSLYVSDEKDYEKINSIIGSLDNKYKIDQGHFDELVKYFSVLSLKSLILDEKKENVDDTELYLFRELNTKYHRIKIKDKTGIDFTRLSLVEQRYFINYLKFVNNISLKKVKDFNIKYNESGFRTFLSIEQGGREMGDKILTLGEKLPKESADILFKTYGEMIDASEEVADLLRNNLGEKATPDLIQKTQESLLVGGKELLERYAKKAEFCEGKTCEDIGGELEERLSLAKKSVFAFSFACKVLVEKGEFSFEDFHKAKLAYDRSPLPEKMQEEIIKMHQENTKQYPEKLRNLWRGTLKDGLENPNPNQLVVSVSYEDDVVSAMRVIQREDGSWYGASFNVNPTVQGGRIGTELLKEVLKNLAKDKPFVADCYSKNPMLQTYLNKFGFKITKEVENYHNTGELVYEITIFPERN